jgi:UDP-N-acetylglucosamine 2-epimerase (non-hydrolysing)
MAHRKIVNVVIGTRPGIIKMAPVYHAVQSNPDLDARLTYTGQHYSATLKDTIWMAFDLPEPDYLVPDIHLASSHATQLAKMMVGCEQAFLTSEADVVLVCGDANTNLAAGIVARKLDLELGHVESGLRSYDWSMPEEHNRIILDHISDFLFAPTENCKGILHSEKVKGDVYVTGNTVVDAIQYVLDRNKIVEPGLDLDFSEFVLFTIHRQENVDNKERLIALVDSAIQVAEIVPLVFPVHPRTRKMLEQFDLMVRLKSCERIVMCDPLQYTQALWLDTNARVVLND